MGFARFAWKGKGGTLKNENLPSNQIIEKSDFHPDGILEALRDLLAHGFVGLTAGNEYYLKKKI